MNEKDTIDKIMFLKDTKRDFPYGISRLFYNRLTSGSLHRSIIQQLILSDIVYLEKLTM